MSLKKALLNSLPVRLIRRSAIRYDEDGLTTVNAAPFLFDPEFQRAYAAGEATGSWGGGSIRWRAHVFLWATGEALKVPGDFVECGVNRGGLSMTAMRRHDWKAVQKRFFLLDTFEGFDARFPPADLEHWDYQSTYDEVCDRFRPFGNVEVIRGPVPDTLDQVTSERFAFVHIDMNSVVPEKAALEFFWPKLSPGGMLIMDDYGFKGHEDQQRMHDEFAAANGFRILALPTGQGLAVKS
jgi:hypothetical protein